MNFRHVDIVVISYKMDFQSAMETFAEAWAAANTVKSEVPSDLSQVSVSNTILLTFITFIFLSIFLSIP